MLVPAVWISSCSCLWKFLTPVPHLETLAPFPDPSLPFHAPLPALLPALPLPALPRTPCLPYYAPPACPTMHPLVCLPPHTHTPCRYYAHKRELSATANSLNLVKNLRQRMWSDTKQQVGGGVGGTRAGAPPHSMQQVRGGGGKGRGAARLQAAGEGGGAKGRVWAVNPTFTPLVHLSPTHQPMPAPPGRSASCPSLVITLLR